MSTKKLSRSDFHVIHKLQRKRDQSHSEIAKSLGVSVHNLYYARNNSHLPEHPDLTRSFDFEKSCQRILKAWLKRKNHP